MHHSQERRSRNAAGEAPDGPGVEIDDERIAEALGHESNAPVVRRDVRALAEVGELSDVGWQVIEWASGVPLGAAGRSRSEQDQDGANHATRLYRSGRRVRCPLSDRRSQCRESPQRISTVDHVCFQQVGNGAPNAPASASMGTFSQDLRYALRNLTKSPMFTAVALLSLALGIGANTAIFSLMNQVLLRLLPVKEPERLVLVQKQGSEMGMVRGPDTLSYPMYRDLRDRTTVFDGLLAYAPFDLSMSYKGQTERITGDLVSGNYFDVLGTDAAIGRTLTADDEVKPGGHPVTVLSYGFWTRRFARDPRIVDQAVLVNGTPLTVVGVTKRGFTSAEANRTPDIFVSVAMKKQMTPTWDDLQNRRAMWLNVMGRLKPGVKATQAQAALNTEYAALVQDEVKELPAGMSENARRRFLKKP